MSQALPRSECPSTSSADFDEVHVSLCLAGLAPYIILLLVGRAQLDLINSVLCSTKSSAQQKL